MRIVVELVEDSSGQCSGMMYLRGFEKNTVIGCDYLVVGYRKDNRVSLSWEKLVRQVNLNTETCGWLRNMTGVIKTGDGVPVLEGNWMSLNFSSSHFTATRNSEEVSSSTLEELEKFANDLFTYFENNGYYLAPAERKFDSIISIQTDSAELALEIRSKSSRNGDSVSIYLDGERAVSSHDFSKTPLRLRIQLADSSTTSLVLVNESLQRNTLKLTLSWLENGLRKTLDIQPSHSRNSVIYIRRRKVSE